MHPHELLAEWMALAEAAGAQLANAMCLSTADGEGRPSGRMVLLRGLDGRGLVFFTNYESRKAQDIKENSAAAANFWWPAIDRQVRVEGEVEKVSTEESDAYFAGRPRDSRLAAWASNQSQPIDSREELDGAFAEASARFPDEVPRPPYWGGYRLVPNRYELWTGRPHRLHDRLLYIRSDEEWQETRLAP